MLNTFEGLVALSVFAAGCAGPAALPPAQQPLPGNHVEDIPVGEKFDEEMITAAGSRMRDDNRFHISALYSPSCPSCNSQVESAGEIQAKWPNVDLTRFTLKFGKDLVPFMILQYGSCESALVTKEISPDALMDMLKNVKDGCTVFRSLSTTNRAAPLTLKRR